ncbi:MAG: methyltransferase domain-containing protein [Luteitalea sp.]|nr:methyltransferase domain-containing protein [Luteitalea sp.]
MGELPLLKRIRTDFEDEGLVLVNVSVDRNCDRTRKMIADRSLDWPQVCDGGGFEGELARAFSVDGTPTQYVLNREGRIVSKVTARLLRTAVATALAGASGSRVPSDVLREESRRDRWQRPDDVLTALGAKEGAAIADIGAGRGYFTARIADAVGSAGRVYAVEIDPREIERLTARATAERRPNVSVIAGKPDDPRLPEGALDAVLIVNAYHEIEHYTAMLEHLHRSLKPGGRLVIEEHVADSRRAAAREEQVRSHEIAPALVERELRAAGFDQIERREPFTRNEEGDARWLIVARRPAEAK